MPGKGAKGEDWMKAKILETRGIEYLAENRRGKAGRSQIIGKQNWRRIEKTMARTMKLTKEDRTE